MKTNTPNKIEKSKMIRFLWADFYDTSINEILFKNIVTHLRNNTSNKSIKVLPNWLKVHNISRSGYRIIEVFSDIDSDEKFKDFIKNKKDIEDIYGYDMDWYLVFEGKYYLIVSINEKKRQKAVSNHISDTRQRVKDLL